MLSMATRPTLVEIAMEISENGVVYMRVARNII
jgi:hypothetical protein